MHFNSLKNLTINSGASLIKLNKNGSVENNEINLDHSNEQQNKTNKIKVNTDSDSLLMWDKIMKFYEQNVELKPVNMTFGLRIKTRNYYSKEELLNQGLNDADINTYFQEAESVNEQSGIKTTKYVLKRNLYINGEKVNDIDSLVKAINNNSEIKETTFSGGLYKKESLLAKGFSEDELTKYFTVSNCSNNGIEFVAYTLKNNLYANGAQILNVDILLNALRNNGDVQEIGKNSDKTITNDLCMNSRAYFLSNGLSDDNLNKYFIQIEAIDNQTGSKTVLYRLKRNLYVNGEKINDLQTLLNALKNNLTIDEIQ